MLLQIKKFSEKLLLPLAKKLIKVPANYFTLFGLISAIITFFGFIFHWLIIIIVFLFITEFFDQLDGVVARLQGPTLLGGFLDSTLDRIGDFFLFVGIIFGAYTTLEIGILVLVGAFLTSYTRAKIESLGIDNLYGVGILERTDRVPVLFIGSILQIWFTIAIWWTMVFLAVGTNITALHRIIYAFRKLPKKETEKKESVNS
ncbi:MAG: CDP-alcohol phosphatidyltransferase family protein [Candidatus Lokiarchaeia archaeon]|nr:CDP-alcohol phosphatidyltransferase family protein [Candidatus Lokiarchaeia archaeon]